MQPWRTFGLVMAPLAASLVLGVAAAAAQEAIVDIQEFQYSPRTITVPAGTTITWTNLDAVAHTVTADDHEFDSELISRGDSFTMTFDIPGLYPYYCIPHGTPGNGMIGVVEVVAGAGAPVAQPAPGRPAPTTPVSQAQLERNKQAVVGYYTMAFNDKMPAEAVAQFVGPMYIQHNPLAADGPDAFIEFVSGFVAQFPEANVDIRRVIAEGDLVVTHSHFTLNPDDRGSAVMDIFRLENGKIVEHWDVLQPIPEAPLNENTMF